MSNDPPQRKLVGEVTARHFHRSKPTEWFDVLYREARGDEAEIPWADGHVNPNLLAWAEANVDILPGKAGRRAFVAGCGLGDDAEFVAAMGLHTLAVDVSETAIHWCRDRFPQSSVEYIAADLLQLPFADNCQFDFVLEIYTVQSVPPEWRSSMMEALARLVAPGGTLLSIARGRDSHEDPGELPWPLTREELQTYEKCGLEPVAFDDFFDNEEPPERRFRSSFRRAVR